MAGKGSYDDLINAAHDGLPRQNGEPEAEGISLADMDGRYGTLRPANKPMTRLHVVEKGGMVQSFQFVHLQSGSTFAVTNEGHVFTLEFMVTDRKVVKVTVHGRNLWRLFDYCTLHRWAYLRAADRDFAQGKETIITAISVRPMEEE